MRDGLRGGEISKEERREGGATCWPFCPRNLEGARSAGLETSSSIYVSEEHEWRKSPPTQHDLSLERAGQKAKG